MLVSDLDGERAPTVPRAAILALHPPSTEHLVRDGDREHRLLAGLLVHHPDPHLLQDTWVLSGLLPAPPVHQRHLSGEVTEGPAGQTGGREGGEVHLLAELDQDKVPVRPPGVVARVGEECLYLEIFPRRPGFPLIVLSQSNLQ